MRDRIHLVGARPSRGLAMERVSVKSDVGAEHGVRAAAGLPRSKVFGPAQTPLQVRLGPLVVGVCPGWEIKLRSLHTIDKGSAPGDHSVTSKCKSCGAAIIWAETIVWFHDLPAIPALLSS